MKRPPAPQALAVSAALGVAAYAAAPEHLIEPKVLIVDGSLSRTAAKSLTMAARRYDTFWHTGDGRYAALSPDFLTSRLVHCAAASIRRLGPQGMENTKVAPGPSFGSTHKRP
jgi:hypothetical protein